MMFSRTYVLSILLALLLGRLALNALTPLMDPSEARYAAICKNMSESGRYLQPRFIHDGQLVSFEGKPPFCFQLGALSCTLFGVNEFAVRLPSFAFAIALLAGVYYAARTLRNPTVAVAAVFLCLTSGFFYTQAGLCMTDMALAGSVTLAVLSYMLFCSCRKSRRKRMYSIVFFAALGLGMIIKGPVALVMAGLPVFFFTLVNNRWQELKDHAWIAGSFVFLAIVVPPFWLMQRENPNFLEYFIVNENFKRFLFAEYGDRFGSGRETFRGMAVIWLMLVNLPALLLLLFPAFHRADRWRVCTRSVFADPCDGLCALTVICMTGFWSLTSRVLITYLLPTVPMFSMYLASRFDALGYFQRGYFVRVLRIALPGVAVLLLAGFSSLAFHAPNHAPELTARLFRHVEQIVEQSPELLSKSYYFASVTPYSAQFYIPDKVRHHKNESLEESLANSTGHLLFVTQRQVRRHPLEIHRPLILSKYGWNVYSCESSPEMVGLRTYR